MTGHKKRFCSKKEIIMALTQKERSARNYKLKKENGLCPKCGKPLDREGHYCSECLKKTNLYRKENRNFYRENHLCTECGKVKVFGEDRVCPECRAKREFWRKPLTGEQKERYGLHIKSQQRMIYHERSENGICTRCGKRKDVTGKKKCAICLEKDAEQHRKKHMDIPNIKQYRKENHLCYFCGNEIDLPSGNICSKCQEKFRKNGRKYGGKNTYWKEQNKLIFGGKKV